MFERGLLHTTPGFCYSIHVVVCLVNVAFVHAGRQLVTSQQCFATNYPLIYICNVPGMLC